MKKLIEKVQDSLIVCDNVNCDYSIPYSDEEVNLLFLYIDMPCPLCGDNVLTKEDYETHRKYMKAINWINRWFSWITVFHSSKRKENIISVHVHDGIKIKNIDPK